MASQGWVEELVGSAVLKHTAGGSESVQTSSWSHKTICLYFSAHWCPPCKKFTPLLAETYKVLQEAGREFEVVFISFDRDEAGFENYFASMPWCAVPYEQKTLRQQLAALFSVQGIPRVVIIGADGVINSDARFSIEADTAGNSYPWQRREGTQQQQQPQEPGKTPFWQTLVWAVLLWLALKFFNFL